MTWPQPVWWDLRNRIEHGGVCPWGKLTGGVPLLGPLGWIAKESWPRQWILQLRFDGLRLSITKSVEEPELLLLYFLPLLNNSCVTQCLLKGECWRIDRNPERNVWWGEWDTRLTLPSAQLWHLPHLIRAFSLQVTMKKKMLGSSCQTVKFGGEWNIH